MSQEIVKLEGNNTISLEYSSNVKEEVEDEYYLDNKVCVFETIIPDVINTSNTEINEHMSNDKLTKYEALPVDHIKTDFRISEVNATVSNNVKIEDEVCPADEQFEYCNELLFCNHCHEVYQDYCTKCRVLIHILNERPGHRIRELPKYILETRESIGHLGIFSLKVIPEDVRFGPFNGLDSTRGLYLRIKGGRFVVSDDQLEHLNWMQYINPARNISEQNLFPFQYEDKLYYCSTRRIQVGEELLVYFGAEYEDNLLKNVEMDFVPISKNDIGNVFACIFCCLGFSSKDYLAEHKAMCHSETREMFSVEELAQCPFCKIYLEAREYFEHHMNYCCESNDRYCVLPTSEICQVEIGACTSQRSKPKRWKRGVYKCTQCKFRTLYNADFKRHINEHYKVKMYKCGICHRRYKAKESLKTHLEKFHADNERRHNKNTKRRSTHSHHDGNSKCKFKTKNKYHPKSQIKYLNRGKYKCANCEFKTYYSTYLERHAKLNHAMESNYKCSGCEFETNYKSSLGRHTNIKHLKASKYECVECEYKTNVKSHLTVHVKTKHLNEKDYKCIGCGFQTSYKSNLETHVREKHLNEKKFQCMECEYKTSRRSDLEKHMRRKHQKGNDYKCEECEFDTNIESHLEIHMEKKHPKRMDYKCEECEFRTTYKSSLQTHSKTKHLKSSDYKCTECEFQTNVKSNLEKHIKRKHQEQNDYQCAECEFKTNINSDLERHIKTKHLKEMAYNCVECEYKTNIKSHLAEHIKTKHLNIRDYKCAECEFETNYKSHLKMHTKTKHLKENDFKCVQCEYKTSRKTDLEKHIKRKHLQHSDYKCAKCEFKTNIKSDLERHIKRKHLKQNDYKCAKCEFETSYKSNLEAHIKAKHHKEKKL